MTLRIPLAIAAIGGSVCAWAQTQPVMPNVKTSPIAMIPQFSGSQKVEMTLDQAVGAALKTSPAIALAKSGLIGARGRTQAVEVGQNPTLALSHNYIRQSTFVGPTATTVAGGGAVGYSSTLTLKQLVFDFGRTRSLVDQVRFAEESTREAFRQTVSDVALSVRLAFLNVDDAARTLGVATANVQSRELDLRLAQARLKSGLGQPADVVRATTQYDDALQTLSSAQANLVAQQVQLANLIGIDPRTAITPILDAAAEATPEAIDGYVRRAFAERSDLASVRETAKSAEAAERAAAKTSAPSLTANATVGARGDGDPFGTQTLSGGLTLTWTFGDGGATSAQVKQARALADLARAQLKQLEQSVVAEIGTAWAQWQANLQRAKVLATELANAEEAVRLAQGRYREGVGTFLEVTDAQATLVSARLNYVGAVTAVRRAQIQIRHGVGENFSINP